MSWKPVTQPAADSQPSSSNAVVFSSRKASLQDLVEKEKQNGPVIGLEYIVEIQSVEVSRNTIFKCILCEYSVDVSSGIKKILEHIHALSHKLHYLEKHFKLIKDQKLVRQKNVTTEGVNRILEIVEAHFGRLQCHLVIGANKYSANEKFVTDVIQSGTHFEENSDFLSYLCKELEGNSERDKVGADDRESSLRSELAVKRTTSSSSHSDRRKQDTENSKRRKEKSSEGSNPRENRRNRSLDRGRAKSKSPQTRSSRKRSSSRRRRHSRSRDEKRFSRSPRRRRQSRSIERGRKTVSKSPIRRRQSRSRERSRKKISRSSRSRDRRQKTVSRSPRRSRSKERSVASTPSLSPEARRKSPPQSNSANTSSATSFDLRSKLTGGAGIQQRSKSPARRKKERTSHIGIMGHWVNQSRRKQQRSRSSSKSPEKEKTPSGGEELEEDNVIQVLEEEPNRPTDEHRRRVRELKLREEGKALRQLAEEKGSYLTKPSSHPRHIEMWNKFWFAEQKKNTPGDIDLTKKWETEWRKIVEEEYMEKMKCKKAEISQKWNEKLRDPNSLTAESTVEIVTLSESESEDLDTDRPQTPPPPQIFSGLAQTEQEDIKPTKARRYSPPPPEDVDILSLLNLLVQLSEKNLLSCGEKIQQMRALALKKEECEYGSSQKLLDNIDCFNLMDSAGEALRQKQTAKLVPEIHSHVVKIVLAQISVFLQTSDCQKSDILEIESFSPIRTDDSNVLKMSISKNIEKELHNSGKSVNQQEFNSLVEAEYVRVKHNMPRLPSNVNVKQQPMLQLLAQDEEQDERFSVYSSATPGHSQPHIDWTNIQAGVTSIQYSENIQNIQSVSSIPSIPSASPYMEQKGELSAADIASLLKNSNKLRKDEKNKLQNCLRELKEVDPNKMERINNILHRN